MTLWLPRPQNQICLDLHGYNGCRYRLTRKRCDAFYSVEITRPGTKNNAVLTSFTKDTGDAEAFMQFLVDSGARPEQLPHAVAAYYCANSKNSPALT